MCFTQPVQQPQLFDFQTSTVSDAKAALPVPDSMRPASMAVLAAVWRPFANLVANLERIVFSPEKAGWMSVPG